MSRVFGELGNLRSEGRAVCELGCAGRPARLGSGAVRSMFHLFYFEKIRVFKASRVWLLNILAWDNRTGQRSCFVGFDGFL